MILYFFIIFSTKPFVWLSCSGPAHITYPPPIPLYASFCLVSATRDCGWFYAGFASGLAWSKGSSSS